MTRKNHDRSKVVNGKFHQENYADRVLAYENFKLWRIIPRGFLYTGDFSGLAELLGLTWGELATLKDTDKITSIVRGLGGPNGWAVYKMLEARRNKGEV